MYTDGLGNIGEAKPVLRTVAERNASIRSAELAEVKAQLDRIEGLILGLRLNNSEKTK